MTTAIFALLVGWTTQPAPGQEPARLAESTPGKVVGTITYAGRIPKVTHPDASGTYRDLIARDRASQGLQQAVVYLSPVDQDRAVDTPSTPVPAEKPPAGDTEPAASIDQREFHFEPHLTLLRQGQTIDFTNSDSGNHHLRTSSSDPRNELATYTGPGGNYRHRFFAVPNRAPIYLGCDIHLWMGAWIFVFDEEPCTVTDDRGRFKLLDLVPGRYRLHVRQPDGGLAAEREVVVESGKTTRCDLEFSATDLHPPERD